MDIRDVTAQIRKLPGRLRSWADGFIRSLPRETSGMFLNRSGHHYWAALAWFACSGLFIWGLFSTEPRIDDHGNLALPGHAFTLPLLAVTSILLALRRFVAAICRVTGEHAQEYDPWRADRLGVAALLLFIAPIFFFLVIGRPSGPGNADTLIAILVAVFAVAVFSDWATRPMTLAKTLRAQPQEPPQPDTD